MAIEGIDRSFFESQKRSREIRDTAIEAIKRLNEMLALDSIDDKHRRSIIESELEQIEGKFIGLGITARMQTGKSLEQYKANPVLAAEYLAGQVMDVLTRFTNSPVLSQGEVRPAIEEMSEKVGDDDSNVHLIESKNVPPKVMETFISRDALSLLSEYFDVQSKE